MGERSAENIFLKNSFCCVPPFKKISYSGEKNTKKSQKLRDKAMAIRKKTQKNFPRTVNSSFGSQKTSKNNVFRD